MRVILDKNLDGSEQLRTPTAAQSLINDQLARLSVRVERESIVSRGSGPKIQRSNCLESRLVSELQRMV